MSYSGNIVGSALDGVILGAAYGMCFSNPVGVMGCAVYGASLSVASNVVESGLNQIITDRLNGLIKTISLFAVSVFSVYIGFFAANAVSSTLGYAISVIPSASAAVSVVMVTSVFAAAVGLAVGVGCFGRFDSCSPEFR